MPLYRAGDRVVLFMHVPKTGGTSIEQALVSLGATQALKTRRREGTPRKDKLSRISAQHLHYDLLRELVPVGFNDYAFTVVRHPLQRLLSSYRWDTRNRPRPPSLDRWFLLRMWKHRRRKYYADNHMRPQADFVADDVEVFRFEDGLEGPVQAACRELRLDWRPEHLSHEKRIQAQHPVRVFSDTLDRIKRCYAADFAHFGYDVGDVPQQFQVVDGRHPFASLVS